VLDETAIGREQAAAEAAVHDALERAFAAPDPEPGRAHRWLYAGDRSLREGT
jgi:DNA-directed RNA polymerase specialized sigma24 family protein